MFSLETNYENTKKSSLNVIELISKFSDNKKKHLTLRVNSETNSCLLSMKSTVNLVNKISFLSRH